MPSTVKPGERLKPAAMETDILIVDYLHSHFKFIYQPPIQDFPLAPISPLIHQSSSGVRRHWQMRWWTAVRVHPNVDKSTLYNLLSSSERFSSAPDLRPTTKHHMVCGIKSLDLLLGRLGSGSITGDCNPFYARKHVNVNHWHIALVMPYVYQL